MAEKRKSPRRTHLLSRRNYLNYNKLHAMSMGLIDSMDWFYIILPYETAYVITHHDRFGLLR